MRASANFVAASVLLLAIAPAQSRDEREAAVGMRARIEQIVLNGSELVAAPTAAGSPIVLRVLATWPHGEHWRYDLEWSGLEPGEFDLAKFLARKNGSPLDGVVAIPVRVTGVLPTGRVEPRELAPVAAARLHGYRATQIAVAVLWGIGLLLILFVGRRWRRHRTAITTKPTLADRLRPLVEVVAAGRADDATKAELERVLVACWRSRLGLRDVKAAAAIVAIREHAEAGALLRQVEAWLHAPVPPASLDLETLLAPYRNMSADDLEPGAARAEVADVR